MSEWRKLNQLCTKITDGSHFSPVGVESGYPMLSVKDMKGNGFDYSNCKFINEDDYKSLIRNDCKPLKNDILIAKDGSYLKHVFVIENEREEAILSSIGILRPNLKLIDPYYIKYYLDSDFVKREVAKKYVSGSALPRIILKNFGEILVPYIEKTKQTSIVNVLKSIDSKIALNNRINAELEAMAKTVYDYWFVQFDFPFDFAQGKPSAEGKPYKNSGGKMVWSEELKREVPEGWEVDNLFKIANLEGGGTPSKIKNEYWGGNIPFYTPSDYNNEVFVMDTESSITKSGLENCSSKLFPKRTIFITARGTVGNIAITAKDTAMNQSCYAFCNHKEYSYTYLYYTVKSLINSLKAKSAGSVFNSIVTNDIKFTRITIAPKTLVKQYSDIVEPLFAKILLNQQENQQLSSLRDWLLPMLMNGQVKVGSGYEGEVESLMAAEAGEKYGK